METITHRKALSSIAEYRDLRVWQRAMELTRCILRTSFSSQSESSQLLNHIQETAIRLPATIATGYNRGTRSELIRHLNIARGELAALDSYCVLANQLEVINFESRRQIEVLIIETTHLIEQANEKWQELL